MHALPLACQGHPFCSHYSLAPGPCCLDLEIFLDSFGKTSSLLLRWAHLFLVMDHETFFFFYFFALTALSSHPFKEEAPHPPGVLPHFCLLLPLLSVTGPCCRRNVRVPPKLMLKPNPPCAGIWRRGLWEVIMSQGWGPHEWD